MLPADQILSHLRNAAFTQLAQETGGDRPTWRTVFTDSESLAGIALSCTADSDLHIIADYPDGPLRDEHGMYDCCPGTWFETGSTALAAYVVALLNADAEGGGDRG